MPKIYFLYLSPMFSNHWSFTLADGKIYLISIVQRIDWVLETKLILTECFVLTEQDVRATELSCMYVCCYSLGSDVASNHHNSKIYHCCLLWQSVFEYHNNYIDNTIFIYFLFLTLFTLFIRTALVSVLLTGYWLIVFFYYLNILIFPWNLFL